MVLPCQFKKLYFSSSFWIRTLNVELLLVFARLSIFLKSGGVTWTIQKVLPEEIRNFVNFFSGEFVERVRIELTADGKHLSKGDPNFGLNGTRNSNKKCYWWNFINMICTDVFNLKWLSESRTATRIITSSRAHACVSPIPKKIKT